MAIDDGHAVSYTALEPGIPVFSSDEQEVGTLREVLDNEREHIFDGIVIQTGHGDLRFVDAPEVARTAERAVTLKIDSSEAERLPPPEKGSVRPAARASGLLGRLRRRS